MIIIDSYQDLVDVCKQNSKFYILGKGSNLLIKHSALEVPFIKLGDAFSRIEIDKNIITIGACVAVNQLLSTCQQANLGGMEFMAGVPASIGGMIAMNFGCWNVEMSDIVESVDVYIPQQGVQTLTNSDCQFSYRTSIFQEKNWIILNAQLKAQCYKEQSVKKIVKDYVKKRLDKQPLRAPTFGSIFKNPDSITAGELIERQGLKGKQLNGAKISLQHANFLENTGNASAEDAILLLDEIVAIIWEKEKIKLIPEVKIFN